MLSPHAKIKSFWQTQLSLWLQVVQKGLDGGRRQTADDVSKSAVWINVRSWHVGLSTCQVSSQKDQERIWQSVLKMTKISKISIFLPNPNVKVQFFHTPWRLLQLHVVKSLSTPIGDFHQSQWTETSFIEGLRGLDLTFLPVKVSQPFHRVAHNTVYFHKGNYHRKYSVRFMRISTKPVSHSIHMAETLIEKHGRNSHKS